MKRFAVGAALIMATGGLAGCGGDGADKPAVASKKEFCAALEKVSETKDFKGAKQAVEKLQDLGVPKGIPADARTGLEKLTDIISKAKDEDAARKSLEKLSTETESMKTQKAAGDYIAKTCPSEAPQ